MTAQTRTIDGVSYEIRELRLRDVDDLFGKEGVNFSAEIFKRAVYRDGQPIGESAGDLSVRAYTTLLRVVNKLNSPEDEPGNE